MQPQILVPLDGSALAETILPHAQMLAQVTGSSLTLLQVLAPPVPINAALGAMPPIALSDELIAAQEAAAQDYLTSVAAHLEQAHLKVYTAVITGDPASTIVSWAAQDPPLRMVAMATHGRSGLGRWVLGSVAEKVLHAVATPLLLVRGVADAPAVAPIPVHAYQMIVVPLDGSRLAEEALGRVLPLAKASRATLILGAVEDVDSSGATELGWVPATHHEAAIDLAGYLAQTAERVHTTGVAVETRLMHGHPAEGILQLSDEVHADLIAMSTHGRGGIQRFWLGSIAMKVVQSAHRPVLLVRAG